MVPLAGLAVQVEQNCYGVGGQDTGRDHRVTEGCHRRRERREGARHRRDGEHTHTCEAEAIRAQVATVDTDPSRVILRNFVRRFQR